MSLSIRVSHGEQNNLVKLNTTKEDHKSENNGNTIFTGNLGQKFGTSSVIQQKKQDAQKQAMKLIGDAWSKDQKAVSNIDDMHQQKTDKLSEIQESLFYLEGIQKSKNDLQEEYSIDPESMEQKDLELLEKYQNYLNGSGSSNFTKEEVKRLSELQYMPRTEYQNKALELNGMAGEINNKIYEAKQKYDGLSWSIEDAILQQSKSQDMIKANNASDEIMEAAGKEILGILVEEVKENTNDKLEEELEKANEAAEKQEEKEKQIEEAKENREEQEKLIKNDMDAEQLELDITMQKKTSDHMSEAQKKIQTILKENNLINEDLKGIEIDFNF
ncbi:MAG: hypothetical protein QM644_11605 [Mobilitalea sp.]